MNVDNQARRIGEQEGGVVGTVFDFQDNPGLSRLELRDPDLFQQPVIHVKGLAQQRRSQVGVEQIKKDSLGIVDALGIELYVSFQANGDPGVARLGPVTDAGDVRHLAVPRLPRRAWVPHFQPPRGSWTLAGVRLPGARLGALESSSESSASFDRKPACCTGSASAFRASLARWWCG